jgi:hypothetical protein
MIKQFPAEVLFSLKNTAIINKSYLMKKAIFLFVSVLFIYNGFSQNVNKSNSADYSFQVQLVDSARTFTVNYANGEEFRKILVLTWGRPDVFAAGSMVWNRISLPEIGNNLKITLNDGVESTDGTSVVFKTFTDDNSKYHQLNDLKSNQKRKITLVFTDQLGVNIVTTKSIETAVIKTIEHNISAVK